jgi:hypothetical protein
VSPVCESVRLRLPAYGLEKLSEPERREVREHLAACADCRSDAASQDPALLFAGLPAPEISSGDVASLVASVRAGIDWKEKERRLAGVSKRADTGTKAGRIPRAAAAAVVALLTLALPSSFSNRDSGPPADRAAVADSQRPSADAASRRGAVEASSGATVYDWSPGAGEPRVVWIVDGSLDI